MKSWSKFNVALSLVLSLVAGLLLSTSALTQVPVDKHTTFLARFDKSPIPNYCAGDWQAAYSGDIELVKGKFSKAASLDAGQRLTYQADEKINPQSGTIEFWLKSTWEPGIHPDLRVLSFRTPSNCYLNFNAISETRLGMAIQGESEDARLWRRVDLDPSGWIQGEWHHLAGVWNGNVIQLYLDGELADELADAAPMADAPEDFTVGPGPLVIDELRISDVARFAEEITGSASTQPRPVVTTYLTDLEPVDRGQTMGTIGFDAQHGIDDRKLPLVIRRTAYARGIGLRAPGYVEYDLPEGFVRLTGQAGASAFGMGGQAVRLTIAADGRRVFETGSLMAGEPGRAIDISIAGVKRLRLEAQSIEGEAGGLAGFADVALLPADGEPPPSFARKMTEDEIALQCMRIQVAKFQFKLPEAPEGYVIYAGHPMDMIDVTTEPRGEKFPEHMRIVAAPGEYEAAQFIICAARDLPGIEVTCGSLSGTSGEIPDSQVDVRLVRRVLMRKGYWMKPQPESYETVSRFLFPNREFWLPAGNLKEIHLIVHVPNHAQPGSYQGMITVAPKGMKPTEFSLVVDVLPIEFIEPPDKHYGVYYQFTRTAQSSEILQAELADIAAHGCSTLKANAGIVFERTEDGTITWHFDQIRALLTALREHNGHGPLTVYDRIDAPGRLLGIKGVTADDDSEPFSQNARLLDIVRQAFTELKQLDAEFPEFEIVLTHMDEVFGRNRLPRYMDMAEVIRKTSDFRIYITMHTKPGRWEKYMKRADEYIDIRCHNGHSLDEWLAAGNTFEDLADLFEASGDEGWIYYNIRGSFFLPEWTRIVNGLYMWMSPLKVHVPWMYYSYGGNPFDDTDSERHDFGYALPSDEEPTQLIPTLHWEAFREGYDDMRYIATLEDLIRRAGEKGIDTGEAEAWLDELRSIMPRIPDDIADIELESPLLVAISSKFTGADYDRMRWHTARQIVNLQKALGD